ncbi:hypothetical protein ACFX1R_007420 [Malus domestica]
MHSEFSSLRGISDLAKELVKTGMYPDIAREKTKMIYASYKNMLKGELDGVQVELQVTDRAEIALDVIKRHVN